MGDGRMVADLPLISRHDENTDAPPGHKMVIARQPQVLLISCVHREIWPTGSWTPVVVSSESSPAFKLAGPRRIHASTCLFCGKFNFAVPCIL
jgi:hypothetical protein